MLTLQALMYIERHSQTGRTIQNYALGILSPLNRPDSMLRRIALFNSAVGKWAPMQAEKQPEHRRASTTKEQ